MSTWMCLVNLLMELVMVSVAVKIVPYLVAFLVALGMFRAAGGFDLIGHIWAYDWVFLNSCYHCTHSSIYR